MLCQHRAGAPLSRVVRSMKPILTLLAALFLGFLLKVGVVEVERYMAVRIVDRCLDAIKDPTPEQETACYQNPGKHTFYRVVGALNFQPMLWKNSKGRCVGETESKSKGYFQCGWWNEFPI